MTTTAEPRVRQRSRPAPAPVKAAKPVAPSKRKIDAGFDEGFILLTRTPYRGEEQIVTKERIRVPTFPVPPAHVGLKVCETINTGNYSSVRVECSIHMPCLPEMSEVERVKDMCADVVDRWMEVETARHVGTPDGNEWGATPNG